MYLIGQWGCAIGFARALRVAFQHNNQFRWNPNDQLTKIHIYDEYPLVGLRYPCVTIRVEGGPAMLRGIGGEIAEETGNPVSINGASYNQISNTIYSGNLKLNVTMTIYARTAYERATIADWIDLFIRHFAVDKFLKEGIQIEDMNFGPQMEQMVGSDPVYMTSVSATVLTPFTREVPVSFTGTVDAICITGVFSTLPDGVTLI